MYVTEKRQWYLGEDGYKWLGEDLEGFKQVSYPLNPNITLCVRQSGMSPYSAFGRKLAYETLNGFCEEKRNDN